MPPPDVLASLRASTSPQGGGWLRSESSQRVGDRQIYLARICAQDTRREQAAAVALAGSGEQRFELAHVEVGGFAEAGVFAVQRSDAVHRFAVDGAGKTARERGAVAGEVAAPFVFARRRVAGDGFEIDG